MLFIFLYSCLKNLKSQTYKHIYHWNEDIFQVPIVLINDFIFNKFNDLYY